MRSSTALYASLSHSNLAECLDNVALSHLLEENYVVVNPVTINPPTLNEIDSVIERASGRLLQELGLYITLDPSDLEALSERIYAVTSNPEKLLRVLESLQRSKSSTNTSHSWSYLKSKYPCQLCGDVLAAPNVACHNSCCGACLMNLDNTFNKNLTCPDCNMPISSTSYERNLSTFIESLVENSEDCPQKYEWYVRNQRYAEHCEHIHNGKDYNKILTEPEPTPSSLFQDFVSEHFSVIVFSCLVLIAVLRRNK